MADIFTGCGHTVAGMVSLLWLAPDHIHLYVESDGEKSPDMIMQELKMISQPSIHEIYNGLNEDLSAKTLLWDEAYFVETIS